MTILTAKVAGVKHVIGCTPPIAGQLPAATISAMHLAGADEIFILGGVQAIAAMALGTETIAKVDFLAGPGNAFVAEAKRQMFGQVGIDLFAGPTEVLVVADEYADPYTCAVDLLSQCEHGPDTPAQLITNCEKVGKETLRCIDELLKVLPTAPVASASWKAFGEVIVTGTIDEAYKVADEYASEHVQILTQNPRAALEKMTHYGAIFLGKNTCVSYGDKVSKSGGQFLHALSLSFVFGLTRPRYLSALEPTTSSRRAKHPATRAVFGSASFCAPRPTRKSETPRRPASWADCVVERQGPKILRLMPDLATCAWQSCWGIGLNGLSKLVRICRCRNLAPTPLLLLLAS
jgi:hypothetical protein